MKKEKPAPSRQQGTVLRQLVDRIPTFLVARLARKYGVDAKARSFDPWSHLVAMLYGQLAHALSLNDICDALRLWATPLRALRGATPPSRNGLSHANKVRDWRMAHDLFWEVLNHLEQSHPCFGRGTTRGLAWRFRRTIHVVDATVIPLLAKCLPWAEHKRRKAAAKCHLRLSLRSLLPVCAIVDTAREHDTRRAVELCAGLRPGEIVVFDKAYNVAGHLRELDERGVFFVTRAKENVVYKVKKRRPHDQDQGIIRDEVVVLGGQVASADYPGQLRRVTARVLIDGKEEILVLLTNNFAWAATSIAELYRCRWQIEAFFKQMKQTLQLADFLGTNANAVKWQIWTALLVYVLLRFQTWLSQWAHSFSRLCTLLRAALWQRRDLAEMLRPYGTAKGHFALLELGSQRWLPGFVP